MKLKNLFHALFASALVVSACSGEESTPAAAGISVDATAIEFDATASSKTVNVTATRDWSSKVTYDSSTEDKWLTITPASGSASSKAQTVEITALPNAGYDRTATVKFTIGLADAVVTVSQTGTKVKTYKTIAQVREYAASNGINSSSNITLPADYVVKAWFISNQGELDNLNSNKSAYVQDETGGLNIFFSANNTFAFGDQVEIDLSGAGMKLYGGVVEVDGLALDKVTKIGTVTPTPKQISLADFVANKYESQYVTFGNVQSKNTTAETWYTGSSSEANIDFVTEDGVSFQVRSSKYSKYGSETVPTGSGKIAGIAGSFNDSPQIIFAQASDYAGLTGTRFAVATVSAEGLVVAVSSKAFLVKTADGYAYAFDASDAPTVKVGDNVKVSGEKDEFYGLEEIINYTVETVSSGNTVTHPAETALDGAGMNSYSTMFGYVSFSGKLSVSGSYYNVTVTGSDKTGSLSNPVGVDAALSGKIVDVKGYFIGFSGSGDKYFNVILTDIKESEDQSGADTPGGGEGGDEGDVEIVPGENEVLYSLTNDEIKTVLTASSTTYADVSISSASGTWTGNINPSSTISYLQLRNKSNSHIKSPVFGSKVVRIVLQINEKTVERTIHALPSSTTLPTDSNTYPAETFNSSYGSVKTAKSVKQNVEIKITGDVKDFMIVTKDGAVYIDAIHVFCEK